MTLNNGGSAPVDQEVGGGVLGALREVCLVDGMGGEDRRTLAARGCSGVKVGRGLSARHRPWRSEGVQLTS